MPEYIEREALLKDISESVVFTVRSDKPSLEIRGANKIIDRIKSAPTADVVEVVRCKDCKNRRVDEEIINRQKAEIERLTAQRDKTVKDFEEFARIAFENTFTCKYCAHSVENGRACLWKEEHEEETCLGRHFEFRRKV